MISVLMIDPFVYEVRLDATGETDDREPTVLTVDLSHETYLALSARQFTQEWVIIQSIQYLTDRVSDGEDLPARLDLAEYAADASFVEAIEARLHRR